MQDVFDYTCQGPSNAQDSYQDDGSVKGYRRRQSGSPGMTINLGGSDVAAVSGIEANPVKLIVALTSIDQARVSRRLTIDRWGNLPDAFSVGGTTKPLYDLVLWGPFKQAGLCLARPQQNPNPS